MKNWNPKANEIFLDAIELDSDAARTELIQQACGEQPELEAEVLAMLASYDRSSEFLETSKVDTKDSGERNDETVGVYASKTPYTKAAEVGQGTFDQGTMLDRYRIEWTLLPPDQPANKLLARLPVLAPDEDAATSPRDS